MNRLLIKNGTLVNPAGVSGKMDILVENGRISAIASEITAEAEILDAGGLYVLPGLVDMHAHFREPGQEYKEDIASGSRAAVCGGFTAVAVMPNTDPVIDNVSGVEFVRARAAQTGLCRVYPIAALTKGQKGEELAEMGLLTEAGAVAFSDDGHGVQLARTMHMAMRYAHTMDALIIDHCEDDSLVGDGVMNEGVSATRFGLKGITRLAEEAQLARDLLIAEETGARIHIAHVSTRRGVELIAAAKARGVMVTAETAPHYISLTDEMLSEYDANAKVNPPLRTHDDMLALKAGLREGVIDAIATDHAPHHPDEKRVELAFAKNGVIGLETAFAVCYTHLVETGALDFAGLVEKMSVNPAKILGVEGGVLKEGAAADITLADTSSWTVTADDFRGKSRNSPFIGMTLCGRVRHTIVDGVDTLGSAQARQRE